MVKKKYVVVGQSCDGGSFCQGIFDSFYAALGRVMTDIENFHLSYMDDGDIFEFTDPYMMEGDGGWCIEVTFKSKVWTYKKEPYKDYYMILLHKEEIDDEKTPDDA